MALEMIPQASLRSDAPALRPVTPRRVRDTGVGILVWIAVIIYFMEFRYL
jgi:hypothetical protein